MPQDPFLYGRPFKKAKKATSATPSSITFTAQMTSLISSSSKPRANPRPKGLSVHAPSAEPAKESVFVPAKTKQKQTSSRSTSMRLKSPTGTHDEAREREFARQKMEAKAKLYDAMKRGDRRVSEGDRAPLIDFDTKWANMHDPNHPDYAPCSSSDSEDDGPNDASEPTVEWEDEFGRLRHGTRLEKEKQERRRNRGIIGQEELERISARPVEPKKLIFGDTVQTYAFRPTDELAMEELARKRDRSATPPELAHYDANREIRDKGAGFYAFSKAEEKRQEEMASLENERRETEQRRADWEGARWRRKLEIEERRKIIDKKRQETEQKKASKMADDFLAGLGMEMIAKSSYSPNTTTG